MKKPWVVGLLSIIPGLGFIVLGEARRGFVAFILTILPLLGLLVPWEVVSITCLTLGLIVWVTQGYYAVVLAQRQARAEAGLAVPESPATLAPPAPGASFGDRKLHGAKQTLMQLLQPGEHLKVALHGATGMQSTTSTLLNLGKAASGVFPDVPSIRQVYLGITEHDLVLVRTDAFGKPSELQRIPLEQVALVGSTEGTLSDEVVIDIGEEKPLRVGVGRPMRGGTRELVRILTK
jgi:hypothetical protein